MNKTLRFVSIFALVIVMALLAMYVVNMSNVAFADEAETVAEAGDAAAPEAEGDISPVNKALASALAIGLAAAGGAVGMGIAAGKTSEAVSRQPEAEGKIRSSFMLGLVFIETAIIYALLVVILIIFVL